MNMIKKVIGFDLKCIIRYICESFSGWAGLVYGNDSFLNFIVAFFLKFCFVGRLIIYYFYKTNRTDKEGMN